MVPEIASPEISELPTPLSASVAVSLLQLMPDSPLLLNFGQAALHVHNTTCRHNFPYTLQLSKLTLLADFKRKKKQKCIRAEVRKINTMKQGGISFHIPHLCSV